MYSSPFDSRQWENFHPVDLGETWGIVGKTGSNWMLLCEGMSERGAIFVVNALLDTYAPDKIVGGSTSAKRRPRAE